jgi:hypothetical protein
MREKVERGALNGEGAAVRLTEYEVERRDGFVNRMNKETTSFFFTNYPADTQVVELWRLFAKFGRVGEVYIPKKLNKQGQRFGFVKFKEVTNVVELSKTLGDIWIGTYHLRINLARFGRNKQKSPSTTPQEPKQPRGGKAAKVQSDKSFKSVVVGETSKSVSEVPNEEEPPAIPILDVEVEDEFLQTLIGSYVGLMKKGVEIRALQMKFNMAGLQAVQVAAMGGGLVLFYRGSQVPVGSPVNSITWWGDLLEDIRAWTPNLVCSRRKLWVRLYGIPLHAWGIKTFKAIASRCGEFITVDAGTMNRNRFDVARVQLDTRLLGYIDFVIKIRIQGALYKVRVVEEGVGPKELDGGALEDQMGWSVADSSCHSGGGGQSFAVVEGLDSDDSDCGAPESLQQGGCQIGQGLTESTGGKKNLEKRVEIPLVNSTKRTSIPSIVEKVMETDEARVSDESLDRSGTRLLVDVVGSGQLVVAPAPADDVSNLNSKEVSRQKSGGLPVEELVNQGLDSQEELGLDEPNEAESSSIGNEGQTCNIPISYKLDSIIQKTRASHPPVILTELSEEETHSPDVVHPQSLIAKQKPRNRKPVVQLPFPEGIGHKCLRLVGAINGGTIPARRRKTKGGEWVVSTSEVPQHSLGSEVGVMEASPLNVTVARHDDSGIDLTVVLPIPNPSGSQSGVRALLQDGSLQDVDGFIASREDPGSRFLEAEKLIQTQQALGICFDPTEQMPVGKLIAMEERDRDELAKWQESNGSQ